MNKKLKKKLKKEKKNGILVDAEKLLHTPGSGISTKQMIDLFRKKMKKKDDPRIDPYRKVKGKV